MTSSPKLLFALPVLLGICSGGNSLLAQSKNLPSIDPSTLPRIATVDERFQSYNIEMVEVTADAFGNPTPARLMQVPQRNQPETSPR